MKSAKNIISHIKNTPLYQQTEDLKVFKSLLPSKYQNLIFFTYLKSNQDEQNTILMIALYHPLGLFELKKDSNIKEIKELLKIYINFNPASKLAKITDIKFFVANKTIAKNQSNATILENYKKELKESYIERSQGEFKNNFKDEKLHNLFENLRRKILDNRAD